MHAGLLAAALLAAAAPLTETQVKELRARIERTLFVSRPLPALDARRHGSFEPEPGVVAERVTYSTQLGLRVPAILYLPKERAGRVPALIVVNGHGGDKYSWYAFYTGVLYARAGAAVLTYDPLGEGERNPERKSGTRAHDMPDRIPELGRRMAGQMITDVMQAVSYLSQRPEVDPHRIAAAGYSLGSFVLVLAGALETRLNAVVPVGGGNLDGPDEYWDRAKPLCTGYPYRSLGFLGDRAAVLYALHARRGATFLYNGLDDSVVNIPLTGEPFLEDLRKRTAAVNGSARGVFEFEFTPRASHRPFFVTRPVALWLERRLDLPRWSEADIRALPETHISEWARRRNVELDRLYATEHREGGTRALGADVPGLTRAQLSVFRDQEWPAQRSSYAIDEWNRRVRALLADRAPQPAPPPVTLVEKGRAKAVVVLAGSATTQEKEAASELIRGIEKITGARLPLATRAPASGARVLLGKGVCPPAWREALERLGPDGYLIRDLSPEALMVAGNPPQGAFYAVSTVLERFGGMRWLWPGELGEVAPKSADFRIGPLSWASKPAFLWRDLGPRGALWGPLDKWEAELKLGVSAEHQREQALWERRNLFGGLDIQGGHAFGEMLSPAKYGHSHPEYFALVNGKRDSSPEGFDGKHGRQPCTSNPEVIRIVAEYAKRFFREHPGADAFNISLNDGRGFCECERCRRLDTGETELEGFDPETGKEARYPVITDRVLAFANEVAGEVAREHPSRKLILFAYGQYKQPPKRVTPHPNLIIQYTMHVPTHWNAAAAEKEWRALEAWSGRARHLAIYEYFIQGGFPDMPRLFPELLEPAVQRLHQMGYLHYQTQHGNGYAINGFNYYLLGKLLWDPSTRADAVLRDYARSGFGQAAPAVERYLQRLARQWRSTGGTLMFDTGALPAYERAAAAYPEDFRRACGRDLEEAAGLVGGLGKARVEFLQKGLRYIDLTQAAVEKTLPLFRSGWKLAGEVTPPASPDWQAFRSARQAWEERDRYIESLKNDFVISHLWVRYNDSTRRFNPLARMSRVE